jgi:deoxycytidine triphosphate deaminase
MIQLTAQMATVLPDREIKSLLGRAILGGSQECVRVNSYEVRLGHKARFDSTGEEVDIPNEHFLEIEPGEFVSVESLEKLDLTPEALGSIGKSSGVFALITPTTTMMREGFLFASTKVDAGYKGTLNWGIRNSSIDTVRLRQGEGLFKLTFWELSEDEKPDHFYGENELDYYQGTSGIKESARTVPAKIADRLIVMRSQQKIDPINQLAQAGHPFNHIGTELIALQGQFQIVSQDVALVKNGFDDLKRKIETETQTLATTISGLGDQLGNNVRNAFGEQFGLYFDQRMMRVYGTVATIVSLCLAAYKLLIQSVPSRIQGYVLLAVGVILWVGTILLTRPSRRSSP